MHSLSADMARLLVTQRLDEAEQRRRRHAARAARAARAASAARAADATEGAPRVPQQRRGSGLLARIVPRTGVRADAH
jgi:hypothetical protein